MSRQGGNRMKLGLAQVANIVVCRIHPSFQHQEARSWNMSTGGCIPHIVVRDEDAEIAFAAEIMIT